MNLSEKTIHKFSFILFYLGVIIGLLLYAGAAWADYESILFDVQVSADKPAWSLKCPIMISPQETGQIRYSIKNNGEKKVERRMQVHISHGYVSYIDEEWVSVELQPGESKSLSWDFNAENAAWERMVLMRLYILSRYPLPSQTSTCGVLVMDILGLSGGLITGLACIFSVLWMGLGIYLYRGAAGSIKKPETARILMTTCGIVVFGLISALAGWWVFEILAVVGSILLILVSAGYYFANSAR